MGLFLLHFGDGVTGNVQRTGQGRGFEGAGWPT
ncbi:hypothetical protein LCGC14_0718530 [marine sediment metagenome]|uniref:Uncharacterized protein n=1 Tax=marine sediment metagenome TaxID=412755 RepID=A0A0F9TKJ9_9ZZZZ